MLGQQRPERALLLDAGGLGIALGDDEPAQRIAEFARHFLPDRIAEEVAEADPAIDHGLGEEDAPAIFGQLHVVVVHPAVRLDADGGAQIDLVMVLEIDRPHLLPPLEILRLPVFERALQALVAREIDVVGNALGRNHGLTVLQLTVSLEPRAS